MNIDSSLKKDSTFVQSIVNEDNFSSIQSHLDKSLFKDKNFIMKTISMGLDISLIDKKLLKDEEIAKLSLDKDSYYNILTLQLKK